MSNADHDTPWLTVKQAAARAQVGRRLIYREVAAHRLKAAHVGGRRELRFLPAWVDAWLESNATTPDGLRVIGAA
jgi:excisionase family DNA binding protein